MIQIPADEIAWALACLAEGAPLSELEEASGRPVREWRAALAQLPPDEAARAALTGRELAIAEGYEAHRLLKDIAASVDLSQTMVRLIVDQLVARGALAKHQRQEQRRLTPKTLRLVELFLETGSRALAAERGRATVGQVAGAIKRARQRGELPAARP